MTTRQLVYFAIAIVLIAVASVWAARAWKKPTAVEPDPGPILPPRYDYEDPDPPTMPMAKLIPYSEQLLREGELKAEARLRESMGRGPIYPLSRYRSNRQQPQHGLSRPNALRPVEATAEDTPPGAPSQRIGDRRVVHPEHDN